MKKEILKFIEESPFYAGLILLIIGATLLIYQIYRTETFKMSEHNVISWRSLISIWVLIIMLLLYGTSLIFRN